MSNSCCCLWIVWMTHLVLHQAPPFLPARKKHCASWHPGLVLSCSLPFPTFLTPFPWAYLAPAESHLNVLFPQESSLGTLAVIPMLELTKGPIRSSFPVMVQVCQWGMHCILRPPSRYGYFSVWLQTPTVYLWSFCGTPMCCGTAVENHCLYTFTEKEVLLSSMVLIPKYACQGFQHFLHLLRVWAGSELYTGTDEVVER